MQMAVVICLLSIAYCWIKRKQEQSMNKWNNARNGGLDLTYGWWKNFAGMLPVSSRTMYMVLA
jgi:hypothetical protein